MGKKKLQRFAENKTFSHVFECSYDKLVPHGFPLKGFWQKNFFNNNNPIILELGCGKAEYTLSLAQIFPKFNYIGVDQKGARLWKGAKYVQEKGLTNVAFIRSQIGLLPYWFDHNEVEEMWITFPDPQPGGRKNKRLTSYRYLQFYRQFLKDHGKIHVKTDNEEVFYDLTHLCQQSNFPILFQSDDIDKLPHNFLLHDIQTYYEKMWRQQGKKIKYICFALPHQDEGWE
ncbi:MAG: tRNA (guanosine(46)-N7)-methyltransferase TrmB [Bacteroidales bacterium]|nr:tRNA (guanosine(46)-N7)-methyltransferase TrmB [Bacteroidales bacterium]